MAFNFFDAENLMYLDRPCYRCISLARESWADLQVVGGDSFGLWTHGMHPGIFLRTKRMTLFPWEMCAGASTITSATNALGMGTISCDLVAASLGASQVCPTTRAGGRVVKWKVRTETS